MTEFSLVNYADTKATSSFAELDRVVPNDQELNKAKSRSELRKVIGVAGSLSELYQLREQVKPTQGVFRDAGERVSEWLDDARWCIEYELAAEATKNLMRVYQVTPDHPVALQLESRLRRQTSPGASDGITNKILGGEPNDSNSIAQVGFEQQIVGGSKDAGVVHFRSEK